MKQLGPTDLKRLHRSWQRRTERRLALLLDGVQSPFNVGAIVRTAAALRVEHLYLAGHTLSPAHPKAGKTAMGTERYLTWTSFDAPPPPSTPPAPTATWSSASSWPTVPCPCTSWSWRGAEVCVAVGHEDHGLSGAALGGCDAVAFIPQLGRVGSLNVATATAIALTRSAAGSGRWANGRAGGGLDRLGAVRHGAALEAVGRHHPVRPDGDRGGGAIDVSPVSSPTMADLGTPAWAWPSSGSPSAGAGRFRPAGGRPRCAAGPAGGARAASGRQRAVVVGARISQRPASGPSISTPAPGRPPRGHRRTRRPPRPTPGPGPVGRQPRAARIPASLIASRPGRRSTAAGRTS